MQNKRLFIICSTIGLWLLASCITTHDLKTMSPDERAKRVCSSRPSIKSYASQVQALQDKISDSQAALSRGYRVHTQCQQVKVYGNASATCSTVGSYTNCQESRPAHDEKRCTETPVSISVDLERSNIVQWTDALKPLTDVGRQEWQSCYKAVYRMTPEEAYKWYK